MVREPDEVIRDLDDLVAQTQRRYEGLVEAQRRIEDVTVTEHSASGLVRVTVRHTGAVVDLALAETTRSMSPSRVAAEVLHCVQRAQARIAERVRDVLRDTAPDDPLADELVTDVRGRFPEPRPAGRAATGSPRSGRMAIGRLDDEE